MVSSPPFAPAAGIGSPARVPDGVCVYAVGDMHGCADLFDVLVEKICADAARRACRRRILVCLGDYVDRGPDSRDLSARLSAGAPDGFELRSLKGNHESVMLAFLEDADVLGHWIALGGDATLMSYGIDIGQGTGADAARRTQAALRAALPPAHLRFLRELELWVRIGDYLFVHAGLRPEIPLERQREDDLIWIREPFLDYEGDFGGVVVVHGHTPRHDPEVCRNRINIDTGAFMTGRLTCLALEAGRMDFLFSD